MNQLKDNKTNKIYLMQAYPFSNYDHVYLNESGSSTRLQNIKKNTHDFVMRYHNEGDTLLVSSVDLSSGVVRVPLAYKQGVDYNYMVITKGTENGYDANLDYWYCFINDIQFSKNLNSCVINFTIDVFNTFIHKISMKQSYIEREHVSDDTPGHNLIDEGLVPSNYKVISTIRKDINEFAALIALGSVKNIYSHVGDRIPPGLMVESDNYGYNPLLVADRDLSSPTSQSFSKVIKWLTQANVAENILGIYLVPKSHVGRLRDLYVVTNNYDDPKIIDIETIAQYGVLYTDPSDSGTVTINRPSRPSGLNNNKVLQYPFTFVNVSNQLGNELTLKFENSNNSASIKVNYDTDRNINGSQYIVAQDYDGVSGFNLDYSLAGLNYPTLPFSINSYDAYISANRNTIANSKNYIESDYKFNLKQGAVMADIEQRTAGFNHAMNVIPAMGNGGTAATAGVGNVLGYLNDFHRMSEEAQLKIDRWEYDSRKALDSINASLNDKAQMPDKYCGRYVPNLLMFYGHPGFIIKTMQALPDELEAIDRYFSRYGYKVNRFATPDLTVRPVFDYKKVIDVNITGHVPSSAINIFKNMFNSGITIWHDYNNLFNFSISNK